MRFVVEGWSVTDGERATESKDEGQRECVGEVIKCRVDTCVKCACVAVRVHFFCNFRVQGMIANLLIRAQFLFGRRERGTNQISSISTKEGASWARPPSFSDCATTCAWISQLVTNLLPRTMNPTWVLRIMAGTP